MKKIIISISAIIILGSCIAASIIEYTATHKTAEVNVYNGIAVFTDSTPVMPYDVLGNVVRHSSGGFLNDGYFYKREGAIKEAKELFPRMDGIILAFKTNGTCNATAIKFK